jgi:hypothetical protein
LCADLYAESVARRLDEWDAAMVARLYSIYARAARAAERANAPLVHRSSELLARLCTVAPSAAAELLALDDFRETSRSTLR